jgi:AcrR family transcriptional regulator
MRGDDAWRGVAGLVGNVYFGAFAPISRKVGVADRQSRVIGALATEIGSPARRRRGRPQEFDRDAALQAAMTLFWERGYEGTSFDDLVAAMRISPSSFYNSFGSKQLLYQEATGCFIAAAGAWFTDILSAATDTRTAFARLLAACAEQFTRADLPAGCMISLAGTHVPPSLDKVRAMMTAHRARSEEAFAARIRRGIEAGELPADTDVAALAGFLHAVVRGMAVLARDGASRARLVEIGRVAMQAWPAAC